MTTIFQTQPDLSLDTLIYVLERNHYNQRRAYCIEVGKYLHHTKPCDEGLFQEYFRADVEDEYIEAPEEVKTLLDEHPEADTVYFVDGEYTLEEPTLLDQLSLAVNWDRDNRPIVFDSLASMKDYASNYPAGRDFLPLVRALED